MSQTADSLSNSSPSHSPGSHSPRSHSPRSHGIAPWNAVRLVAKREMLVQLRSKAYIVSFAVTLLAIIGAIIVMSLMGGRGGLGGLGGDTTVVTTTASAAVVPEQGFEVTEAPTPEEALEQVRSGDADSAVLSVQELRTALNGEPVFGPDGAPVDVADVALGTTGPDEVGSDVAGSDATGAQLPVVVGDSAASEDIVAALSVDPPAVALESSELPQWLGTVLSIAFGFMFFMAALMYCTTIAQSVVEEKATRIIEILLATVSPRVLMFGKVLGNAVLALAQIGLITIGATAAFALTGQGAILTLLGPSLIWFGVLFAFGFVLIASLYAGAASLVSRQEDVASAVSPLTFLIMIPYLLVVIGNQSPLLMGVLSYIPFSAPVGMPVRLLLGDAAWWEPVIALALLIVTTVVSIIVGARMYEQSILRIGSRVSWKDALRRE